MDSKTRKKLIIFIVVLLIAMLIPVRSDYKDGGTVRYQAIAYNVTKWHALQIENYRQGIYTGTEVSVFGFTVYNDAEFVPDEIEHSLSPAS